MWSEVLYWIDHVWSSIECVCCACGPSEHLDAPSICFICVFECRKLSSHSGVWEMGNTDDGDGVADLTATARIRNGWISSKSFCHF